MELWWFFLRKLAQAVEQTISTPAISDAMTFTWRHFNVKIIVFNRNIPIFLCRPLTVAVCDIIYNKPQNSMPINQAAMTQFSAIHDDVIKWKHFTGHLCGEFTGHRWIPHTKASDAELWCSLICARINGWVNNREAGDLRRYRGHYDVTVMKN